MSNQCNFDEKNVVWHQNKIIGGIAEAACRAHFEALGYAVENTGVEHIAPQYSKLKKYHVGNYIGDLKKLHKLPDFLISRTHPSTPVTEARKMAGKDDAVLIEAKYRTEVVLEDFTKEMLTKYGDLLQKEIHFIVYLVCRRYKLKHSDAEFKSGAFVWANFFIPHKSKTDGGTGWQQAGVSEKFIEYPLYQGMQDGQNFNTAYEEIIKPALRKILG